MSLYSAYGLPDRAPKACRCLICQDRIVQGGNVYRFAHIDPKTGTIEYAYAHIDCVDKRAASRKDPDYLPEAKVRAFWDGVERLMNKGGNEKAALQGGS